MPAPGFGTDGVRGVANAELTADVALALGRAVAEVLAADAIVVGRDTRISGQMIEAALVAGITSSGVDVRLAGVVPTPAVAFLSEDGASGGTRSAGAMISASHNPYQDNGIKLFAPGGLKLGDDVERRIEQRYKELLGGKQPQPAARVGSVREISSAPYVQRLISSVSADLLSQLSVVVDSAHGSAAFGAPVVFDQLCGSVVHIGAEPNGTNINDGVGSTSPQRLQETVVRTGSDMGLAFDGDADRVLAVDHQGDLIDGDHILAILAKDWKRAGRLAKDTVVVTVMSNFGFKKAMDEDNITVKETAVGDRYVLEALHDGPFNLGGEQSGHIICRDLATTGDGMLAGLQLLETVARTGKSLRDLAADAMTSFPQVLRNLHTPNRDPALVDALGPAIEKAEQQLGHDGRVLVRMSGTEPLLRVMVEARTTQEAEDVCQMLIHQADALLSA